MGPVCDKNLLYFRTIQQLLRARHEHSAAVGDIPRSLLDTSRSNLADDATKKQVTLLANMPTTELWDCLLKTLTEASTSVNMAIFSLDKVGEEREPNY